MDLTFDGIIQLIANNIFGGSMTLAGLAVLLAMWAVAAIICLNMKAPPVYSIVPLIPLSIFFFAYGMLNQTVMVVIVLVASVLVASEFKKAVD